MLLRFKNRITTNQARSQGGQRGQLPPPISERSTNNFQGDQPLDV